MHLLAGGGQTSLDDFGPLVTASPTAVLGPTGPTGYSQTTTTTTQESVAGSSANQSEVKSAFNFWWIVVVLIVVAIATIIVRKLKKGVK